MEQCKRKLEYSKKKSSKKIKIAQTTSTLTLSYTISSFTISWSSITNATNYTLNQSNSSDLSNSTQIYSGTATSFSISNISTPGTYYYEVIAVVANQVTSNIISVTITSSNSDSLTSPTLNVSYSTTSNITISWSSVNGATSYTLQQSLNDPTFASPQVVYQGSNTSYDVASNLSSGIYYYQVLASDSQTTSSFSNSENITILSTPVLNSITNNGSGSFAISWNSIVNSTSYTLYQSTSSDLSNPTQIYSGDATSFSVTNQSNGTFYYSVMALSNNGPVSSNSNIVQVVISTSTLTAPTLNSIAPTTGSQSYIISWSSITNATSYSLQQSTNSTFSGATTIYSGSNTTFTVTNQSAGTFYYQVFASNSTTTSSFSNTVSILILASPILNSVTNSGSSSFTVSWNAVTNASSYVLNQSTSSTFTQSTQLYSGSATSFSVSNLSSGTFYYQVIAYNGTTSSPVSNIILVTVSSTIVSTVLEGFIFFFFIIYFWLKKK